MPEVSSAVLADALRRLKLAERTVSELRAALLPKHPEEEVEAALAWLTARKLLSEERAVDGVVRPRTTGRRAEGNERIRNRLESRGADPAMIERALAEAPDELERMQEALTAKFRTKESVDRGKAGRFLHSRGFDDDSIESALDRFFTEG